MSEPQIAGGAVTFVLERFNAMLDADGARLELVSATGDALTLRYIGPAGDAPDAECEACAFDPDDLELLVGEALQRQGAATGPVTVLR